MIPILQDPRSSEETTSTLLSEPEPSHEAAASVSETVADSPILLGEHPHMRSTLSSSHRSWRPLSDPMNECTSSMMTNLSEPNMRGTSSGWLSRIPSRDSGVICSIPSGCSSSLSFLPDPTSPCHPFTGMLDSLSILSRRENWSSIRARVGPTYIAPTPSAGWEWREDTTGMSAASVLPEDVPDDIRRWSSVSKRTSNALS